MRKTLGLVLVATVFIIGCGSSVETKTTVQTAALQNASAPTTIVKTPKKLNKKELAEQRAEVRRKASEERVERAKEAARQREEAKEAAASAKEA